MTQARSRWLGRALAGGAAPLLLLALALVRRRWWLLPVAALLVAAAAGLAWSGVTLAVMQWDQPADYPPAPPAFDADDTNHADPAATEGR